MTSRISFHINGKLHQVGEETRGDTSLLTYLRSCASLPGTKYMCKEGGCGACVVHLSSLHPATGEILHRVVNSCLIPVVSCHGAHVTTVEGLGDRHRGYHRIQTTLARHYGTQCGFCSPGMVLNMYSLLKSKPDVTMKDVENSFGGNICRCTGYRPIMDAFKSLASDADNELKSKTVDIEDLWKMCTPCNGVDVEERKCNENLFCDNARTQISRINNWYIPSTLKELLDIFDRLGDEEYMLVAGNTSQGVYKRTVEPSIYIYIQNIPDLCRYEVYQDELQLGANMTLTEITEVFNEIGSSFEQFKHLKVLANHMDLVANVPVRNFGTLAGNLMMKYNHPEFLSDIFILLETARASVEILSTSGEETVPLLKLFQKNLDKVLIKKINLPVLTEEYKLETFKIMPRKQNVHAYVSAGFLFRFDPDYVVLETPTITFGGINSDFVHAAKTESFLVGKCILQDSVLKKSLTLLSEEIQPQDSKLAPSVEYRRHLAVALLYKFVMGLEPDRLPLELRSGGVRLQRPLSSGHQNYQTIPERWPLTKPSIKLEAVIQSSGEAEYVNDIPVCANQLYGSLVLATQAGATVSSIDPTPALNREGVVGFFSADDIPGRNIFTKTGYLVPDNEELFCSGKVLYGGQPLGVIVAETEVCATKAASLVRVSYTHEDSTGGSEPGKVPLLGVKDVLRAGPEERGKRISHFSTTKPERAPQQEQVKHTVSGEVELGPQYHFTMEPQTCVVVPIEDGLNVYSATQWMNNIQECIAAALNIPQNSINMEVRRLGGGFGCKITRSSMVATACALAAFKLHRPVRMILDIQTNMMAVGKRNAAYSKYQVGFNDEGRIEELQVELYDDMGCSENDPAIMLVEKGFMNCYDSSVWEMHLFSVLTDTPSSSWMRAPGTVEGLVTIERIMEHIAFTLRKDSIEVRLANLKDEYALIKDIISTIKTTGNYEERKRDIECFNKMNRWKKRGISLTPMVFQLEYFFSQPAMVSIFAGDGTVSISHGGVEMGQGLNTKIVQVCAHTFGIDPSKIKVKPSTTLISPNAALSGASITSDNVAYSTLKCCEILNERLEVIKGKMKNASWEEIIAQAHTENINLNASYVNNPEELKGYSICGIALTEVEVDILTGEYLILRTDILEDAGESLSPEIDIGQVEGGFVMGLGYFLLENIIFDINSGVTLTNNTWNYWPPGVKDIPVDFRVSLLKNNPNPCGVLRSKATGEPPLCLAISAVHAIAHAIHAARDQAKKGDSQWFDIKQPYSVENICLSAENTIEQFTLI